ncbi:unnamed protein product [Linum trigynum]|uniref:Uncharacterized protein n=1 Tax=Linum trigynum TaxID=586398 RepID=A0AAV2CJ68_9ROSI
MVTTTHGKRRGEEELPFRGATREKETSAAALIEATLVRETKNGGGIFSPSCEPTLDGLPRLETRSVGLNLPPYSLTIPSPKKYSKKKKHCGGILCLPLKKTSPANEKKRGGSVGGGILHSSLGRGTTKVTRVGREEHRFWETAFAMDEPPDSRASTSRLEDRSPPKKKEVETVGCRSRLFSRRVKILSPKDVTRKAAPSAGEMESRASEEGGGGISLPFTNPKTTRLDRGARQ